MVVELDSIVVRNDQPMSVRVDDDLVILNMAGDNYIALDDIGRRIWDLLETPRQVDDLCRQLAGEFSEDQMTIEDDVLPFLNELASERLVLLSE